MVHPITKYKGSSAHSYALSATKLFTSSHIHSLCPWKMAKSTYVKWLMRRHALLVGSYVCLVSWHLLCTQLRGIISFGQANLDRKSSTLGRRDKPFNLGAICRRQVFPQPEARSLNAKGPTPTAIATHQATTHRLQRSPGSNPSEQAVETYGSR